MRGGRGWRAEVTHCTVAIVFSSPLSCPGGGGAFGGYKENGGSGRATQTGGGERWEDLDWRKGSNTPRRQGKTLPAQARKLLRNYS
jgi:hypothetical protein